MKRGLLIYGALTLLLILGQVFRAPAGWEASFDEWRFQLLGFQTKKLSVQDHRFQQAFTLTYQVAGVGPQLIVLHDLADRAFSWHDVVAPLLEDHQVIMMDLANEEQNVVFDFSLLQQGLSLLLANEPAEVRYFLAHGFGAQVLLRQQLEEKTEASGDRKLILVSPLGFAPLPARSFFIPTTVEELRIRREQLGLTSLEFLLRDQLKRFDKRAYGQLYEQLQFHPLHQQELAQIKNEVALIWGSEDPFLKDKELPQTLSSAFPQANVQLIQECGYAPQLTCSQELSAMLRYHTLKESPEQKPAP